MENPLSWTEVEKIIHQAIKDHEEAMKMGVIGLSLPKTIAYALRKAGKVNE